MSEASEEKTIIDPANIIRSILDGKDKPIRKALMIANTINSSIIDAGGKVIPFNGLELAVVEKGKRIFCDEELLKFMKKNFNYISNLSVFKVALEMIHNAAIKKFDEVKIHMHSIFDNGNVYLGIKGRGLLKISEEDSVLVDIGTDNIYIATENIFPPFEKDFSPNITTLDQILDAFEYDESFLSPAKQKLLLKLWFYYSLFDDGNVMRPILLILGESGSGKTLLEKLIKGLLVGFSNNLHLPSTIPTDEHELALFLKNQKYIFCDEVNESNSDIKSILRTVSTGIQKKYRPKYSANMVTFTPKAWLVLNGIDVRASKEADISERLIIVTLKKRNEKKLRAIFGPEREMDTNLDKSREHIWDNIITEIQRIMGNLRKNKNLEIPLKNYFRVKDFSDFAWQAFPDDREMILDLFNGMDNIQNTHSAKDDPLIDALERVIPYLGDNGDGKTRLYKSSILLQLIKEKNKDNSSLPRSAEALSKKMKKIEPYLIERFGFFKERNSVDKNYHYGFNEIKNEEVFEVF